MTQNKRNTPSDSRREEEALYLARETALKMICPSLMQELTPYEQRAVLHWTFAIHEALLSFAQKAREEALEEAAYVAEMIGTGDCLAASAIASGLRDLKRKGSKSEPGEGKGA